MDRRHALKTGFAFAGATLVTKLSFAQQGPPAPAETQASIVTEIEHNHGHALVISVANAILLLRRTRGEPSVKLDIQGQSRHPHGLELGHDDLQKLFIDGAIEMESTEVAGHTHLVRIRLEIA